MRAELLAVRMRSDERAAVHDLSDVPESCLVEVGCVYDHLLVDHVQNSLLSEIAESFGASRCRAVSEAVFFIPCQHAVPCTEVIVLIEFGEGRIIRSICHAFYSDHYIENSVFPGLHHLIVSLYDPEVLSLCDLIGYTAEDLASPFCVISDMRRIHPQNEDGSLYSTLLKSFKMVVVKHVGLTFQSLYRDICPDVAVCVKTLHFFSPVKTGRRSGHCPKRLSLISIQL